MMTVRGVMLLLVAPLLCCGVIPSPPSPPGLPGLSPPAPPAPPSPPGLQQPSVPSAPSAPSVPGAPSVPSAPAAPSAPAVPGADWAAAGKRVQGGTARRPRARRATPPPAPLAPKNGLIVIVRETQVRRGEEIKIYIDPGRAPVRLYFNGEWLPVAQDATRRVLTTTIPDNAVSGHFEVSWRGKRFRSPHVKVDQGF